MGKDRFRYVKDDYWNRALFKDVKTGRLYVDVEGELHNMSKDGEPQTPIGIKTPKIEKENKTITIEVYRGLVSEVKNLPEGWDYEIIDHDSLDELGCEKGAKKDK